MHIASLPQGEMRFRRTDDDGAFCQAENAALACAADLRSQSGAQFSGATKARVLRARNCGQGCGWVSPAGTVARLLDTQARRLSSRPAFHRLAGVVTDRGYSRPRWKRVEMPGYHPGSPVVPRVPSGCSSPSTVLRRGDPPGAVSRLDFQAKQASHESDARKSIRRYRDAIPETKWCDGSPLYQNEALFAGALRRGVHAMPHGIRLTRLARRSLRNPE